MQAASVRALVKVQFLAVPGEDTAANAAPFLAGLAQGGCELVIAVGDGPVGAVTEGASRFPEVRFAVVGASAAPGGVTVAAGPDDEIARLVDGLVASLAEVSAAD
jgi:basic membrane lipoprotein Med (substrate-binding protein (PBP1-ABC) superfamily)